MAIPSGSGTEVLKRAFHKGVTNSEITLITGVANHNYTILSLICCERAGASEAINFYVDTAASGNDLYLLDSQPLGAYQTFVFNDRFVLTGTDKLHINLDSAGTVDVILSYIDQDWS